MEAADLSALIGLPVGGLALYGLAIIIRSFVNRRVPNAEAAQLLSKSAVELIEQARKDAEALVKDARGEVIEARTEAQAARRAAVAAERAAEDSRRLTVDTAYKLERLIKAILQPGVTIDVLRDMVTKNGHGFVRWNEPTE